MQKNRILWSLTLVALFGAVGFLGYTRYYLPHKFDLLTEKILTTAMSRLSEEDRAGQVIHIAIPGQELNERNRKVLTALRPGGIIFFGFNLADAEQIRKFTGDLQALAAELKLPPFLISTDQEGGYVKRVRDGVLQTPPARNLGDTGDSELCRATGYQVSRDLGALGINVFFAPIVDINNNPNNPVIGLRSFGTTLEAVLKCALPFEQGARQANATGGAMPVIKHFPGHGDTQVDSHWSLPVIDKKLEELRTFELIPFRDAIRSGAPAVMTAHILYPQVDKDAPATLSPKLLTETLRGELGFKGVVFTDAMEMSAVSKHYKEVNRPITAIKAGADILLYTSWQDDPPDAKTRLVEAQKNGEITRVAGTAQDVPPLTRALTNQLRAKLPYLKVEDYLPADEAKWYLEYREKMQAKQKPAAIAYDADALKQRYESIRWSASQKKGGPIWLAGQKNQK